MRFFNRFENLSLTFRGWRLKKWRWRLKKRPSRLKNRHWRLKKTKSTKYWVIQLGFQVARDALPSASWCREHKEWACGCVTSSVFRSSCAWWVSTCLFRKISVWLFEVDVWKNGVDVWKKGHHVWKIGIDVWKRLKADKVYCLENKEDGRSDAVTSPSFFSQITLLQVWVLNFLITEKLVLFSTCLLYFQNVL